MSEFRWDKESAEEALRLIQEGQRVEKKITRLLAWSQARETKLKGQQEQAYHVAYIWLSNAFGKELCKACLRIVGDDDAAVDIVHEALLKAREDMPNFKGRQGVYSLRKWLYTIAIHLCFKEKTRRQKLIQDEKRMVRTPMLPQTSSDTGSSHRRSRTTYYEKWEDEDALRQDIARLKGKNHRIIVRMDLHPYITHEEMVYFLDMSPSAVRRALYLAREQLDTMWKEQNG